MRRTLNAIAQCFSSGTTLGHQSVSDNLFCPEVLVCLRFGWIPLEEELDLRTREDAFHNSFYIFSLLNGKKRGGR
jgi:hypothetical protein